MGARGRRKIGKQLTIARDGGVKKQMEELQRARPPLQWVALLSVPDIAQRLHACREVVRDEACV